MMQVCVPGGAGSSPVWWWCYVVDIMFHLRPVQNLVYVGIANNDK